MFLARAVTVTRRRNNLHWLTNEGTYFVTFRLADSLPAHLRRERGGKRFEEELDRGRGEAFLKRPAIGDLVFGTLKHFHGARYLLHSACVMPNHVHVVFRTLDGVALGDVMRSWKTYTARLANRILGREGPFWQREWFEWLLHDERELERANTYVLANPEKAGLRNWPWVEKFDTAYVAKYVEID